MLEAFFLHNLRARLLTGGGQQAVNTVNKPVNKQRSVGDVFRSGFFDHVAPFNELRECLLRLIW